MSCPICKSNEHVRHSAHSDRRKGLSGTWEFHACTGCGFLFLFPHLREHELKEFYRHYSDADQVRIAQRRGTVFRSLRRLFHLVSGDVDPRDFIRISGDPRMLDFGSGVAGYLSDFHARGVRISGAEVATHLVNESRSLGLDVHKVENLRQIPFGNAEFDVVYLMQVFEHLSDPAQIMLELARVLKPGGEMYLAVPNARSAWRRIFGRNWVSGWFAPFHLFQYDRGTLTRLASQHGFHPVASWSRTPEAWFRLNLKAAYYPAEVRLDRRKGWLDARPVRYALMLVLRILELPMRERDCLVMHLRKST
ncbi:MAG: class I SAM-dependent methyltransferase [Gemmatimonadaceae bacterium]